jgi:malonyl-CoA/methylmalonyl-CoA synthetase
MSSKHQSITAKIGEQSQVGRQKFRSILSTTCILTPVIDMSILTFCSGRVLDQNKPSLVIFTSGSTGLPRGVAIRRYNVYAGTRMMIQAQKINLKTTIAQFLPIHHAAGLLFNSLPVILGGGCVEFCQGGFEPSKVWQRFREGGLPSFSAVPTVYVRLTRYWQSVIAKLPTAERDSYRLAASGIGSFHSGTSALPRHVSEQWFEITGKPIIERYGGSEMGNVYTNLPGQPIVPVRYILLMNLTFQWILFKPSIGLQALPSGGPKARLTL